MTIKEHYADILCNSRASEEKIITVTSAAELSALTDASSPRLYLDLVLNRTLDYEAVIELAKQKLTSGGELLVLLASIAPEQDEVESFWGFTLASAKYIFGKHFAEKDFEVFGYGNVLVGRILLRVARRKTYSQQSSLSLIHITRFMLE
jgi:hypothetical protein